MSKYLKYINYVMKHKYYVFIECCKLGIPLRGFLHDISKFRYSEFKVYADYFYGKKKPMRIVGFPSMLISHYKNVYTQEDLQRDFDIAWLNHQHRNKHHWQYWVLNYDNGSTTCIDMPVRYIKEMVADWVGAGKAINGKNAGGYKEAIKWYKENKNNMRLSESTREYVEKLLADGCRKECAI